MNPILWALLIWVGLAVLAAWWLIWLADDAPLDPVDDAEDTATQ